MRSESAHLARTIPIDHTTLPSYRVRAFAAAQHDASHPQQAVDTSVLVIGLQLHHSHIPSTSAQHECHDLLQQCQVEY